MLDSIVDAHEFDVDDVLCARCSCHVPVAEAIEGETLDAMWRWWWFCPKCAEVVG